MKNYLPLLHLGNYKKHMQVILLALAVLLDSFDYLRFTAIHLSLGHLILLFFMAWLLIDILQDNQIKKPQHYLRNKLVLFWSIFWIFYVIGFLHSVTSGIEIPKIAAYDLKSYIFNTALSLLIASSFDELKIKQFFLFLISFNALVLGSLLFFANFSDTFFGYNLLYAESRFSPLSTSPNLIALLLVAIPFLNIDKLAGEKFELNKTTIFYLTTLCVAIYIGIKTESDALFYTWVFIFFTMLVFYSKRKLELITNKSIFLLFALIILLSAIFFVSEYYIPTYGYPRFILFKLRNLMFDVPERLALLKFALEPIKNSILFGHGPGSFSGFSASYQGFDSHNSLFEWTISTGFPGLVLLILFYREIWIGLQKNQPYIFASFCALLIFSLAHNIFSYPVFWILISCFFILSKSVD